MLLLLGSGAWAQSTEKAKGKEKAKGPVMTKEEIAFAKEVNKAIDKGLKYLRSLQNSADGSWPRPNAKQKLGATALAGLALLEGGAAPNDPAVIKAADFVRKHCIRETYNYSVCLSIMFLDRLGDPEDVPIIEGLSVRLLGGQCLVSDQFNPGHHGGWSYDTAQPQAADTARMLQALENRKGTGPVKGQKQKPRTPKDLDKDLLNRIYAIYKPRKGGAAVSDNSNTQFALIALWVARRHGIPVQHAFYYADHRLRRTQVKGGWGYHPPIPNLSLGKDTTPNLQMTCCGLIGLGLSYGAADPAKGGKAGFKTDRAIDTAMKLVENTVGWPKDSLGEIKRFQKGEGFFYNLWTLERMAVLYGQQEFGYARVNGKVVKDAKGKPVVRDWYKWGAQLLLVNQGGDGSWQGENSEGGCDTCFALLFLKRANLTHDLTDTIKKVRPPKKIGEVIEGSSLTPQRDPRHEPLFATPWLGEPQRAALLDLRPTILAVLRRPLAG
jgi:hypothetical protein